MQCACIVDKEPRQCSPIHARMVQQCEVMYLMCLYQFQFCKIPYFHPACKIDLLLHHSLLYRPIYTDFAMLSCLCANNNVMHDSSGGMASENENNHMVLNVNHPFASAPLYLCQKKLRVYGIARTGRTSNLEQVAIH